MDVTTTLASKHVERRSLYKTINKNQQLTPSVHVEKIHFSPGSLKHQTCFELDTRHVFRHKWFFNTCD